MMQNYAKAHGRDVKGRKQSRECIPATLNIVSVKKKFAIAKEWKNLEKQGKNVELEGEKRETYDNRPIVISNEVVDNPNDIHDNKYEIIY